MHLRAVTEKCLLKEASVSRASSGKLLMPECFANSTFEVSQIFTYFEAGYEESRSPVIVMFSGRPFKLQNCEECLLEVGRTTLQDERMLAMNGDARFSLIRSYRHMYMKFFEVCCAANFSFLEDSR